MKANCKPIIYIALCVVLNLLIGNFNVQAAARSDIINRFNNRTYPSIFQSWNKVEAGPGVSGNIVSDIAKHDLYFTSTQGLGLQWNDSSPNNSDDDGRGTTFTANSISNAKANLAALRKANPNLIVLAEIRYWCAWGSYLPSGSSWWKRDSDGNKIVAWDGGGTPFYYLDWDNVDFRKHVAAQCKAAVDTGVVDGVMIDCFAKDKYGDADNDTNRIDLIKRIREAIGDEYLIIVNSNMDTRPNAAPYINGLYMECYKSSTPEDWQHISETITWAENNLRFPRINCLEIWYDTDRNEFNKMRAATTLSLTHSDGYVLFAESDHLHDWYSFWDTDLGKPKTPGQQRSNDKMYQREFSKGTVIYNPMGNGAKTITFNEDRKSAATGKAGKTFSINDNDGDIFTYIGTPPADTSSSKTYGNIQSASLIAAFTIVALTIIGIIILIIFKLRKKAFK